MNKRFRFTMGAALVGLLGLTGQAFCDDGKPYAVMAPIEQYSVASRSEEIALARSAAPASVSGAAEVMILGSHDYETAARGRNGFVCLVERSWAAGLGDPVFWNPQLRAPICFNPAAARSVLPGYLERTRWVLAGVSLAQMIERTQREVAAHTYRLPEPGAMALMQSRQSFLGEGNGHWHPHLMLYMRRIDPASWGANLEGSAVFAAQGQDPEPVTTLFVPVQKWSDGELDLPAAHEEH
jgi:hypothetical protein